MFNAKKINKLFFAFFALFLFSTVIFTVNAAEKYDSANFTKKGDVIYFVKPDNYGENVPKVYIWNLFNDASLSAYPGEAMTQVEGNLYKYEITSDGQFTNLLFNDGNTQKTKYLDFICSDYVYNEENTISYAKKDDVIYYNGSYGLNTYIYMYNTKTGEKNAEWPGEKMTNAGTQDRGNQYVRYVVNGDKKFDKIIFNNNMGSQTNPFNFMSSGYLYNNTVINECSYLKAEDTIYFEKNDSWGDDIYIYMWNSQNEYSAWGTTKMTKVDGNLYSYTLNESDGTISLDGMNNVIFSDQTNQTKNLSIVGKTTLFKINDTPLSNGKYDGFWAYSTVKTSLANLINNTKAPLNDEQYYTVDSYKIYKDQMDLANTLMNTKYIAASYAGYTSQYDKSLIGLDFAYNNLKIDPTILRNKIDELKEVDTTPYENESVNNFNNSITNAENILNDINNITVEKIKNAINDMQTAYDNLVLDKTELKKLIDEANNLDKSKYTDGSVTSLENALQDATNVYTNNNATYDEIKNQISTLKDTISKLELKNENNNVELDEKSNTNTTTENTSNPFTGDIVYIFIGLLVVAIVIFIISFIILKKKKAKNTK